MTIDDHIFLPSMAIDKHVSVVDSSRGEERFRGHIWPAGFRGRP